MIAQSNVKTTGCARTNTATVSVCNDGKIGAAAGWQRLRTLSCDRGLVRGLEIEPPVAIFQRHTTAFFANNAKLGGCCLASLANLNADYLAT